MTTKEREITKKNQILELNSVNEMKTILASLCRRIEQMEDRINDLENRNSEIIQNPENKRENGAESLL